MLDMQRLAVLHPACRAPGPAHVDRASSMVFSSIRQVGAVLHSLLASFEMLAEDAKIKRLLYEDCCQDLDRPVQTL